MYALKNVPEQNSALHLWFESYTNVSRYLLAQWGAMLSAILYMRERKTSLPLVIYVLRNSAEYVWFTLTSYTRNTFRRYRIIPFRIHRAECVRHSLGLRWFLVVINIIMLKRWENDFLDHERRYDVNQKTSSMLILIDPRCLARTCRTFLVNAFGIVVVLSKNVCIVFLNGMLLMRKWL